MWVMNDGERSEGNTRMRCGRSLLGRKISIKKYVRYSVVSMLRIWISEEITVISRV